MDHVYISFSAFLWTSIFVRINTIVLMIKGTISLWIQKRLQKWNLLGAKPFNKEELVAKLLLNTNFISKSVKLFVGTLAIYYYTKSKDKV